MQYPTCMWSVFPGTINGLTPAEDAMLSRFRSFSYLQELTWLRELACLGQGIGSKLVQGPISEKNVSVTFQSINGRLKAATRRKMLLEIEEQCEEQRQKGNAVIPELNPQPASLSGGKQRWLATCAEAVPTNDVIDVLGYVPKDDFTLEEHEAFLKCVGKLNVDFMTALADPGVDKMPGRFNDIKLYLPNRTHQEVVLHYYNCKYTAGRFHRFPLPPRPSFEKSWDKLPSAELIALKTKKNKGNGFNSNGSGQSTLTRHLTINEVLENITMEINSKDGSPKVPLPSPVVRVEKKIRKTVPTTKSMQKSTQTKRQVLEIVAGASLRKRKSEETPASVPAENRGQLAPAPADGSSPMSALKASPRKRKMVQEYSGTPEIRKVKKLRVAAGQGKPKNADEAVLKIIKKRFVQVKESGAAGDAFTEHFLGSDITLPALIPYSQRPILKKGLDGKRVPINSPPQRLKVPEETFVLAQQCLILTFYILQEHRRRLVPGKKQRFNTSQWQHCTFGDASNLHDLGDEMAARGMFTRGWCPALYQQAESDLAALARWEDENAPADGYWPDLDFCSPRMVWRPEVVDGVEGLAVAGSGEDIEADYRMRFGNEEMVLLATLPSVTQDIVLRIGVESSAVSSVYQCVLDTARNHLKMSSNEAGFESMLLATALQEIQSREDEEYADTRILAVVQATFEAGDLGVPLDTRQVEDIDVQGAAQENSQPISSLRDMSADSLPSLTFSTPEAGSASPDQDMPPIAEPVERRVASQELLAPQYFNHITSLDDAPMYWPSMTPYWRKRAQAGQQNTQGGSFSDGDYACG